MTGARGDFELTANELRAVARYVADAVEPLLEVFEREHPDDPRPRAAVDAAYLFVHGAPRTKLQRTSSLEAHRAAAQAATATTRLVARSAGDAASAAYLHPIARATQVGHVLRGPASVARVLELEAGDDRSVGDRAIEQSARTASAIVVDVLRRYPRPTEAANRVSQLLVRLDDLLRARGEPDA